MWQLIERDGQINHKTGHHNSSMTIINRELLQTRAHKIWRYDTLRCMVGQLELDLPLSLPRVAFVNQSLDILESKYDQTPLEFFY